MEEHMRTDLHDIFKLPTQKHNKSLSSKTELCVTLATTNSEPPVRIGPKEMFIFQSNQFWGINSPFVWGRVQGSLYFQPKQCTIWKNYQQTFAASLIPLPQKMGPILMIPGVIISLLTVDGWNPAPVARWFLPLVTRLYTSQVVQDFSHQQYLEVPFVVCCLAGGGRGSTVETCCDHQGQDNAKRNHTTMRCLRPDARSKWWSRSHGESTVFFLGGGGAISNMYTPWN